MMPSGAARKRNNSSFETLDSRLVVKTITLKAIHVMPALLLQKPSINSKSKVKSHLVSIERRLKLL